MSITIHEIRNDEVNVLDLIYMDEDGNLQKVTLETVDLVACEAFVDTTFPDRRAFDFFLRLLNDGIE